MDDPFADLAATRKPCGCKDGTALESGDTGGDADAMALEQALDALEGDNSPDAELSGLENALQEFEDGAITEQTSLEDLIVLAEQHPGLKVTISF